MKKIYSLICGKYIEFKNPKKLYILEKNYVLSLFAVSVKTKMKKYLKVKIYWDIKNSWFD